jgi:hypothetical protein
MISRRMKPILNLRLRDIDEDNDNYLVVGGGYEYLHTIDQGSLTIENQIIAQATPHIVLAGLTIGDRNRTEFRWINGVSNFRYRNRLTVIRQSQLRTFRFAPMDTGNSFITLRCTRGIKENTRPVCSSRISRTLCLTPTGFVRAAPVAAMAP